jgi:hypothetical protein
MTVDAASAKARKVRNPAYGQRRSEGLLLADGVEKLLVAVRQVA